VFCSDGCTKGVSSDVSRKAGINPPADGGGGEIDSKVFWERGASSEAKSRSKKYGINGSYKQIPY